MPDNRTIDERFARIDAILEAIEDRNSRFAAATADAIEQMENRLTAIDEQNRRLAEMVQVLGSYVNVVVEGLQQHMRDGHGGQDD